MIESESFFTEFAFEGFKNIEPITCSSNRMLVYLRWLEWNSDVKSYFQPFININVEYHGFIYSASIDFRVKNKEKQIHLVHLLDQETIQLLEDQPALKSKIAERCRKMQMNYLPIEPPKKWHSIQIKNLNFLWSHARIEIKLSHHLLTGIFFTEQKFPTLGKLKVFLIRHGFDIELAYSMIFHKVVSADIDFVLLSDKTALQSNIEPLRNIEAQYKEITLSKI